MRKLTRWGGALVILAVGAGACGDPPTATETADLDPNFAKVPGYDGDQGEIGKLAFKFNVIGRPNDYDGGCGNGRRIFINRGANHGHIDIEYADRWYIDDCNATGGNTAVLYADGVEGESLEYHVFIRLLGKPGGSLKICSDTDIDHASGDHLCLVGSFNLDGSKDRATGKPISFKVNNLFGDPLEDVIWSVETNQNFRNAEFRVYEWVSP